MLLSTLFMIGILCASALGQGSALGEAEIPGRWVLGQSFDVELRYGGGAQGATLEAWQLTQAAFEIDGKPLGRRDGQALIPLAAGDSIVVKLDLATSLSVRSGFAIKLSGFDAKAQAVRCFQQVQGQPDFLSMGVEQLAQHLVLMSTSRGEMLFELWPEVAPMHVRNWLDLVSAKFYDGLQFHRVSPNFMIQGGCPFSRGDRRSMWGLGEGPRKLKLETSDRKHVKGVLSMARGPDPNSGSSQFFVITRESPQLDNKYSIFGKLVNGYETLAKIGNAPGRVKQGTATPDQPQRITKAIVVRELITKR